MLLFEISVVSLVPMKNSASWVVIPFSFKKICCDIRGMSASIFCC